MPATLKKKCNNNRLPILRLLPNTLPVGNFLFNVIKHENGEDTKPRSFIADKVYGDLARKSGYYARYVFDDLDFFMRESRGLTWLSYQDAINTARKSFRKMNLVSPWTCLNNRRKYCDLLDKQYWDYLMELWLEYDLRASSFDKNHTLTCTRDKIGLPQGKDQQTNKVTEGINSFVVFAQMVMSYTEMTWQGNRVKEHELRALRICRCWAMKIFLEKYAEGYKDDYLKIAARFEPRATKMSSAERLKLALGTFFKTYIDPNPSGECDECKLKPLEETSFVKWSRAVLENAERYDRQDVEILRTFIEIVSRDFFSLCKEIQLRKQGDEVEVRRWYLRQILRRPGEVQFPWHYEGEIERCVESLHDCQVGGEVLPILKSCNETKPFDEKVKEMSNIEFGKLHDLFTYFRKDILPIGQRGGESKLANELGISTGAWSNYRNIPNYSCGEKRKMEIVTTASSILHIERYELVEALFNADSIAFNSKDAEVGQLLEQFVRILRNSSTVVDSISFKDMPMLESGLQLYYENLGMIGWNPTIQEGKIFDLFKEWKMAKQSGEDFYETINLNP